MLTSLICFLSPTERYLLSARRLQGLLRGTEGGGGRREGSPPGPVPALCSQELGNWGVRGVLCQARHYLRSKQAGEKGEEDFLSYLTPK